jgi:hypothetical protein
MKLVENLKENLLLIVLFLIIGGSGFYFLVIHPKLRVENVPEFVKAYVAVKGKSMAYAINDYLTLTTKDEPVLYAVVVAKKKGEDKLTWFTEADALKIDGKIIDKNNIEKWDTFKWKEVRIFWFKIEPVIKHKFRTEKFDLNHIRYKQDFQYKWPFEWTHKLDVNGFTEDTYPRQNVGTMRFKIRAEIKTSSVEFVEKVISAGEELVDENNIISDKVFKVTLIPEKSLFGYALSAVNLAFTKNINYEEFNPVAKSIAVDSSGYFTNAAILSGFKDVKLGDMSSFLKHFKPIYKELKLDEKTGNYLDKNGNKFDISNIKKGFVFVKGNLVGIYAGEGSMEIGKLKYLSSDDRVLMSRDLPLYYEKIGDYFADNFEIGVLQ